MKKAVVGRNFIKHTKKKKQISSESIFLFYIENYKVLSYGNLLSSKGKPFYELKATIHNPIRKAAEFI